MTESRKVGNLHYHSLPDEKSVEPRSEVFRCTCNREFFVDLNKGTYETTREWKALADTPHYAVYDEPVGGQENFIGKWTPEMDKTVEEPAVSEEPAEITEEEAPDEQPEATA